MSHINYRCVAKRSVPESGSLRVLKFIVKATDATEAFNRACTVARELKFCSGSWGDYYYHTEPASPYSRHVHKNEEGVTIRVCEESKFFDWIKRIHPFDWEKVSTELPVFSVFKNTSTHGVLALGDQHKSEMEEKIEFEIKIDATLDMGPPQLIAEASFIEPCGDAVIPEVHVKWRFKATPSDVDSNGELMKAAMEAHLTKEFKCLYLQCSIEKAQK